MNILLLPLALSHGCPMCEKWRANRAIVGRKGFLLLLSVFAK
jgi:hypothetical protein